MRSTRIEGSEIRRHHPRFHALGPEPRQPTPDARGARGVRRRGGTVGTTFPEDDKPCARLAQAAADGGDGLGISGRLADREGSQVAAPAAPLPLWTPAEIRRFLLSAPEEWRPVWLVGIFTGLRPG